MGIIYGILVVVTCTCIRNLINARQRNNRMKWGMLIYTIIIFGFATLYLGSWINFVQLMLIDQRNYPGGPIGFYINATPIALTLNILAYAGINFIASGLLAYRCYIIWGKNRLIMILPVLMYLTTIAFSVVAGYELLQPNDTFFTEARLPFTVPLYSIGIALNILLTSMIGGKIFWARWKFRDIIGARNSKIYTSITSMLVESAALYCGTAILAMANFCSSPDSNSFNFQNISFPINAMSMTISQILIVSKVARGQAYSDSAMTISMDTGSATAISFASRGARSSTIGAPVPSGGSIQMENWSKHLQRGDLKSPSSHHGGIHIDVDITRSPV